METRRLVVAIVAALAVYFAYTTIYNALVPAPKTPPPESSWGDSQTTTTPTTAPATADSQPSTQATFSFTAGPSGEAITLGGGSGDELEIVINPRGAAVERIRLTSRKNEKYVYRIDADKPDPLPLAIPIETPDGPVYSLATQVIDVERDSQKSRWRLDDVVWEVVESGYGRAVLQTTLRSADGGGDLLRVVKTYSLRSGAPMFDVQTSIVNLSSGAIRPLIEQSGTIGFPEEGRYFPTRRLSAVYRNPADATLLLSSVRRGEIVSGPHPFNRTDASHQFAWVALANKYFGVFIRPIAPSGGSADFVASIRAELANPQLPGEHDDLTARLMTQRFDLAPGKQADMTFEVYAGPKSTDVLEKISPSFANRQQVGYVAAQDADSSCCPCQFHFLTGLMIWLLDFMRSISGNYGIAILLLVIVVRTLLHPLSVFQQKAMYRAQDSMARIHPKLESLKEKYANDRQKFGQEQMKLFAEEGVNPLAPMVGFIPLMIQMPLLIALWNALNTDVHLRHAPFDGWWIRDLASPDALIRFEHGFTIPILGWLPYIGAPFQNISSFNLLPILMGVAMWLQQKYMPKPGMDARKEALKKRAAEQKPATEKKPGGFGNMTPEEQLRQQQMIANMMAVMFPIMFYYQPAGLALYWMFTNIYGICESLIIRKQLKAEREKLEREGPKIAAPRKPGFVANMFKKLAEQAEELQKKADELGTPDQNRSSKRDRDKDKDKK